MTVRFGMFDQIEIRDGVALGELYEQHLDLLVTAENAGFWGYHKSEHHMIPLDAVPNIGLFLAAASQRTKRIRLGTLVYLLPFHHPLRLAEEICILDHLTGGRLDVGVGRGVSLPEQELWGLAPSEISATYEESLAVLLEALNTDSLSYAGDKYQFKDVPVLLAPVQRPHPPLWYPGNFEYAARRGMNSVVGGPIPIQVQAMAKYHQLCELVRPGQPHPTVAGIHTIYIAPTDEEAQARMKQAWVAFTAHLTPLFRKWNLTPPKDPTVGGDVAAAMGAKLLLAGSPQTIREFVKQWADETGSDYFIGKFTVGDLTHDEVRRSIELFAEHVMPAVNG